MSICLPPKRWEEDAPRFDGLRHHAWFQRSLKRKKQIPLLREAYKLVKEGQPQWKAAAEFQVDERELRDYAHFIENGACSIARPYQVMLDDAYRSYAEQDARVSFCKCIELAAANYGVDPRAVRELWEVEPVFLPSITKDALEKNHHLSITSIPVLVPHAGWTQQGQV